MINDYVEQDTFGEVINSDWTYQGLAEILNKHSSVIIGWTDGEGSHLDIMLTVQPIQIGALQRGMRAVTDLFVSISHFGMFGFEIVEKDTHANYVGEKLGLGYPNITTDKVAELVNGVRKALV